MLDSIRTLVQNHTSGLTDGQFFGFGIILLVIGLAGVLGFLALVVQAAINYRIDYKLQRRLRDMPHGGLGRKR